MAIQELDLTIYQRAGKHNSNADAFSRAPVPTDSSSSVDTEDTFGIIGAINAEDRVPQVDLSTGPRLSGDNHLPQDRGITGGQPKSQRTGMHCSTSFETFYTMLDPTRVFELFLRRATVSSCSRKLMLERMVHISERRKSTVS